MPSGCRLAYNVSQMETGSAPNTPPADPVIDAYKAALPDAVVLGTDRVVPCLLRYAALGWSCYVPEDFRKTLFMLPANYAPFAWGFPNRLSERLSRISGSRVFGVSRS